MKLMKKIAAIVLCAVLVMLCLAGCSAAQQAEEITEDTLLVAYTQENKPFIYTDDTGNLAGFDVDIIEKIFENVKNDYKNYKFIQVDKDYNLGEDAAYTDEAGNDYIAYVMVGGIAKNEGTFNKNNTFTKNIIDNRIIAVTAQNSNINTYADLTGVKAGIVSDTAKTALDKNSVIKNGMASVQNFENTADALSALNSGSIDVLIIDEFNFNVAENKDNYKVLDSELDTISYVYSFKKWDWYDEAFNEAIYELKSPDYNDADEFTPIVEKHFGYNASNFDYEPPKTK